MITTLSKRDEKLQSSSVCPSCHSQHSTDDVNGAVTSHQRSAKPEALSVSQCGLPLDFWGFKLMTTLTEQKLKIKVRLSSACLNCHSQLSPGDVNGAVTSHERSARPEALSVS